MQEEKSGTQGSGRGDREGRNTNTNASKYKYVFVGAGLAALIFILGMMSAYVLMNGEKTRKTIDAPAEQTDEPSSDELDEVQDDGAPEGEKEGDADESVTWDDPLPDAEMLLTGERDGLGSTMLYATKTGSEVTVYERSTLTGEEEAVFSYTETTDANLDGNLWHGLPANAALSPDESMIAFVDTEGLKVYDRTSGDIETLIAELDPGDPSIEELEPPTWSVDELNAFSLFHPMWSPDSKYVGFAEGYYEGSGFGVVDVETKEYTAMSLNAAGVDLDWAPDNTVLQPGSGGYFARGLLLESVGEQDERVNIAESFGEGDSLFQEARFSPDHQNIVFTFQPSPPVPSDWEDVYTLGVVDRDGSNYEKLDEGKLQTPVFAPNNEDIYYTEMDGQLTATLKKYDASAQRIERITTLQGYADWVDPAWYQGRYLSLTGRHTQGDAGASRVVVLDTQEETVVYAGPTLDVFAEYLAFIQ
jgi:hypothetical protein